MFKPMSAKTNVQLNLIILTITCHNNFAQKGVREKFFGLQFVWIQR